jgi:hypothetical protein
MRIRPEAQARLRQGFQRRAGMRSARYAPYLADAGQFAMRFEFGEVVGVFTTRAGGTIRPRAYLVALLPMAGIPFLIIGATMGIPGLLPLLGAFPFLFAGWFGLSLWRFRERRRDVLLYAFTEGFMLFDDGQGPRAPAVPVRWREVSGVGEVWSERYPSAEEPTPVLTAYSLRCADGRSYEIPRSFENVQDPYGQFGRSLGGLMPAAVRETMPKFPAIDDVIAAYAR